MSSVVSPPPAASMEARDRSRLGSRLAALTPLWAGALLFLAPIHWYDDFFRKPPDILGVPLGMVMVGLALVLTLIGVAAIWNVRSQLSELLVLLVFTTPATLLIVLGPRLIEALMNLG